MEALECIKTRRSIRKFKAEPVAHDTLTSIVETASLSPSWKNSQTVRYHIVEDKAILNEIANNCVLGFQHNTEIISQTAQLVVVSTVKGRCGYEKDGSFTTSKGDSWEMFDAGIASQTFCLAAHNYGVGSVILGIFDDAAVAKAINLPEEQKVSALIAIGYPDQNPDAPKRKDVADLLHFI